MTFASGLRNLVWVACLTALTAACSTAPPPPRPVPKLTFMNESPIIAPASSVAFQDDYKPKLDATNVEQNHDVRPASVTQSWVDRRLRGTTMAHGTLTVTVLDASIRQQNLKMDDSLKARLFSRQPEYKLIGTLKWRVSYKGPLLASWSSEGSAESTSTVIEQASLNDQDQAYADIIDALAQNLDTRMQEQIKELRNAQSDAADASGH